MPDLAQRFLCNIEFDGNRPTNHAYVPKQALRRLLSWIPTFFAVLSQISRQSRQLMSRLWWSASSKSNRQELRVKGTDFPAPQERVNFLMTHGLKRSESIAA